ncbi:MAG: alpha/beta fold hydrolase, partial [Bacteroidota bacterium]
ILLYSILGLFLLYGLVVIGMYIFQDRFVFRGTSLDVGHQFDFQDADFQELWLTKKNGQKINALHFTVENAKGLILYFHGNKDNLDRWGNMHSPFTDCHYEVLMIDYSGYGKSEGEASDSALEQDAEITYDWAIERFMAEKIVLYGRSLGAAVASQLATQKQAKILILETPFNSLEAIFKHRSMLPKLPIPLRNKFSNTENIPQVNYPVHIFHGTQDWVVPYRCAVQLKEVLKEKDSFTTLEGGMHHNLGEFEVFQKKLNVLLGCS